MKPPTLRTAVIAGLVGLLLILAAAKAATVFVGANFSHDVTMQRRAIRAVDRKPTPRHLAAEIEPLLAALRWQPRDADTWYLLGRNLHRLAVENVALSQVVRGDLVRRLLPGLDAETVDQRTLLLRAAVAAYDRAIAANQILSGARVWRLAARAALQQPTAAAWETDFAPALTEALTYDPSDPRLFRAAGDMAVAAGDTVRAVQWYHTSLAVKLDGVDQIAERLLDSPDGSELLAEAIPPKPEAWRRLATHLFGSWRFEAARRAFDRALAFENREALWPSPGEAVLDGDFTADPTRLLHPWRTVPVRGVELRREKSETGGALIATFDRGPVNWYHTTQRVAVEPGGRYRLAADLRLEDFGAGESFGVEVVHPYEASLFAAGARCHVGGRGAMRESLSVAIGETVTLATELTVPPGLRMLEVRLRRFGGKPKAVGRAVFTDVSLSRLPEPEEGADDPS
jgi:hypothetical protein